METHPAAFTDTQLCVVSSGNTESVFLSVIHAEEFVLEAHGKRDFDSL